jgi:hypothetical protein
MNDRVSTLVRSVLKKDSLRDCTIEELQKLAAEYPYFSPAQFLLVQKLKETNQELYKDQVQKLSLHFYNPLWLDHILEQENTEMLKEKEFVQEEIKAPEQEVQITETVSKQSADELSFEPYHTVDYFASQGIKPVQEEKPADRFGQQLKSFTEWLKTMKRLPVVEIEKKVDVISEERVLELAETSIKDDDVITETMADVWIKQGNKEKAIEIYNKLSLLNPSKSDYFAAKIEETKNSLT